MGPAGKSRLLVGLWALAAAGIVLHLAGLGWDLYLHSDDPTLAAREGVFSLENPGHGLIVTGTVLASGAVFALGIAWLASRGSRRAARSLAAASVPVALAAVVGAAFLATRSQEDNHESHLHDTEAAAVVADDRAGGAALAVDSPADDGHAHQTPAAAADGEGEAHTHGQEVAVSADQLLAAAAFYEQVKSELARFEDIRTALDEGFIQITQDLPGIAAHFLSARNQADGVMMDPARPETLLYTKRLDGSWRLVGAMFMSPAVSDEPPSFFGALDAWHRHENLCFSAAGVRVSEQVDCRGTFVKVTPWNLHVWIVPGNPGGVFAHDLAAIDPGPFPPAAFPAARDPGVGASR